MLAMSRWMLMGIHVKLLIAAHTEPLSAPDSVMPAGEVMKGTQDFPTNRIAGAIRFASTARDTRIHFPGPHGEGRAGEGEVAVRGRLGGLLGDGGHRRDGENEDGEDEQPGRGQATARGRLHRCDSPA